MLPFGEQCCSSALRFRFIRCRAPEIRAGISNIPLTGTSYPSHVFFAADNSIKLYVNGALKSSITDWNHFHSVMTLLKHGDVVALEVKDYGVWYGAIAAIHYKGKLHVTGRDKWLATKAFSSSSNAWMLPSYSACHWPAAVLRPGSDSWNPGMSPYFPYYTKARYVWARNAGVHDTIFLRYRIGGEACSTIGKMTFAADNEIRVYVNGREVGHGTDWGVYYSATSSLQTGDVIAVHAKDYGVWYGAFVAIDMGSHKMRTGVEEWKAVGAFGGSSWMYAQYSSCTWKPAVVLPGADTWNPGKARPFPNTAFPYAKYVWADGVRGSEIYMRHVVGGEHC